jgi:hypothetical protein
VRASLTLAVVLTGCSSLLGITDPVAGTSDGGATPDAAVDARPVDGDLHTLVSIAITPDPLTLPLGVTRNLAAIATYADTTTEDVTAQATFAVETGTAVTVTTAGVIKAVSQGSARVTARIGTVIGKVDATVGPAAADHVTVSIGDFTLAQQQRARMHASLVFTDQTSQDVTAAADWQSSDPAIATAAPGVVDGVAPGAATITVSASGVSGTVVATVSAAICHPIINEVQSGDSDSAANEWVELYNPCTVPVDVNGWTLVYRAATNTGASDTNLMVGLAEVLQPGDLRVFGGSAFPGPSDGGWSGGIMQITNGSVGLRSGPKDTGPLVDSMTYGNITTGHPFLETTACGALSNGKNAARQPFDGNDTNVGGNDWIVVTTPTPRALNVP